MSLAFVASGCLWVPGAIVGALASSSGGDDSEPVPEAALSVEILPSPAMAILEEGCGCGEARRVDDDVRAGRVEFEVRLRQAQTRGASALRFTYLDVDRNERSIVSIVAADGSPVPSSIELAPGDPELRLRVIWDTAADGVRFSPLISLVVRWGAERALSRAVTIDNTPTPTASIDGAPDHFFGDVESDVLACGEPAIAGEYRHLVRLPVRVEASGEISMPGDPATAPLESTTLEVFLHVLATASGGAPTSRDISGDVVVCGDGEERVIEWRSDREPLVADARARVVLEVLPRQVKLGPGCCTDPFIVDNRRPDPLTVTPPAIENASDFTVTVNGFGLALESRIALVPAGVWSPSSLARDVGGAQLEFVGTRVFPDPRSDAGRGELDVPNRLSFEIEVDSAGLHGAQELLGAFDVVVENPNGRRGVLPASVFFGRADIRFSGPFYPLDGDPIAVVVGDFFADDPPRADGLPILDAAIISDVERAVVTFFVGSGDALFRRQRVLSLIHPDARPRAIKTIRSRNGGRDGLLVASSTPDETWIEYLVTDERGDLVSTLVDRAPVPGGAWLDLAVGELDGDGSVDFVLASRSRGLVVPYLGRGTSSGAWTAGESLVVPDVLAVVLADFDGSGDGLAELVALGGPSAAARCDQGAPDEADGCPAEGAESAPALMRFRFSSSRFECLGRSFLVPSALGPIATRDDAFFDCDSVPDLLVGRDQSSIRLRVLPPPPLGGAVDEIARERATTFVKLPISTAPSSDEVTAVALIHFGGETRDCGVEGVPAEVLDNLTVNKGFVATSVSEGEGFKDGDQLAYSIPGKGEAVAVADLDGDGVDEIIVVSSGALSVLSVLRGQRNQADLLSYPLASSAGENPERTAKSLNIGGGTIHAGPFVAAVTEGRQTVVVLHLSDDRGRLEFLREERHRAPGSRVLVGDIDADGQDEVLLSSDRHVVHLLSAARDGSRSFERIDEPLFSLDAPDPELALLHPEAFGPDVSIRRLVLGQIDGNPLPDLALTLTLEKTLDHGFVFVAFNVQDPSARFSHLYRTEAEPRGLALANLDDDGANDLLVACEKPGLALVLFGNPDARFAGDRFFVDADGDPDRYLRIPGFGANPADPERPDSGAEDAENVATDSLEDVDGQLSLATFLAVSNDKTSVVYDIVPADPGRERVWSTPSGPRAFAPPVCVHRGVDPEDILVRSSDAMVIVEEDDGALLILERQRGSREWRTTATLPIAGPRGLVLHDSIDGRGGVTPHYITASRRQVRCYRAENTVGARPSESWARNLRDANRVGRSTGLALRRLDSTGDVYVASLGEDGDPDTSDGLITLTRFPAGIRGRALVNFGADLRPGDCEREDARPECGEPEHRRVIRIPDPANAPGALALLSSSASGDWPDVLVWEPARGEISSYRLSADGPWIRASLLRVASPGAELVTWQLVDEGDRQLLFLVLRVGGGEGDPVDTLLVLEVHGGGARFLASARGTHRPEGGYRGIQGLCVGRTSVGRTSVGRTGAEGAGGLFVAVAESERLSVEYLVESGRAARLVPAAGFPAFDLAGRIATVAARDLNRDGRDDLVLVDLEEGERAELRIFEGRDPGPALSDAPFSVGAAIEYPRATDIPVDLEFLDANGDTLVDLALALRRGEILVFLSDGAGGYALQPPPFAGPRVEGIVSADLTGDQVDEIIASVEIPGLVVLTTDVGRD